MKAYHYTIEQCVKSILESGYLEPAHAGVPQTEKLVIWFSIHPMLEPTAHKATLDGSGGVRRCTYAEMLGLGLVRFTSRTDALLPWSVLKRKARISAKTQRRLVKSAYEQGANPMQWYGHIGRLSIAELTLERFDAEAKRWVTP